ncbi:TPA: hypothetical protein O8529_002426 [Staphylococcus aureus]|uniref:hypothetical protein n=1 Tax=Staphylococcus TaxID=1279 RepID=UPI0005C22B6A|nr:MULTISPECIES: hypothetical protein [Staphylococcus]HDH6397886.1 hypothetical protein [Staphylococcus aureus P091449]KIT88943.1 hypothetical protein QT22_01725 [Staphylococcus aureus]MCB8181786.1 hypothetical protein [Staphylococcus aureus]MCD0677410.1 hypothetical protein [Staphylococcus aureus]MCQ1270437.1 hypothetical protein [Staphylococcus aureus]
MEANLKGVKKLVYKGVEYSKVFAGNTKVWSKPPSFVIKPLPKNKYPDSIEESTAKWTINGVEPNKSYQVTIENVRSGIMRVSQTNLGSSDLGISGVNSGVASKNINFSNPSGMLYVTISDVYSGSPTLTIE